MTALVRGDEGAFLEPLGRYLAGAGRPVPFEELVDTCAEARALPDIALALRRRGIPSAALALDASDLRYAPTPSVVDLRGGELAVLEEVRPATCVLEGPGGARVELPHAEVTALLAGHALRVTEPERAMPRTLLAWLELLAAAGPLRRTLVHAFVLAVAQNVVGLLVPLVTRGALTDALPNGARATLSLLTMATLGIGVQQAILGILRSRTARFLEYRLQHLQLTGTFARVLGLPLARVERGAAGELHGALQAAELLPGLVVGRIVLPALDAILALSYVVLLEGGLPGAGWVVLAFAAVMTLVSVLAARVFAYHDARRIEAAARQRSDLYEVLSGISTLRAAGAERTWAASWLGRLVDELTESFRSQHATAVHGQISELATGLLSAMLLVGGTYACLTQGLGAGVMVASLQACLAFWSALGQGLRVPMAVTSFRVLTAQTESTLGSAAPREPRARAPRAQLRFGEDALVVRDLWFRHAPDAPWLFAGLDLRIAAGENVRLSWPSGRGKTTLLRLLSGLYEPERGSVTVFGLDAKNARELICYLPQTTVLFAGSVLHNLRLLSGGASAERIFAAAAVTGLDAVVSAWPMGFETVVTQGGGNLSSGQKQLVALTAALASERPILLLDEATAHLDPITRARLDESRAFAGRTVVTVVHDVAEATMEREAYEEGAWAS